MSRQMQDTSTRARRGKTSAAVTIVLCGLALVAAAFVTAPSAGATGTITVEQTPLNYAGPCVPSALARLQWTAASESTDELFSLKVTNPVDLCDPVTATAVIYAMPTNGQQWPQQLQSVKDFVIGDASVTTITFSKDCTPAQFDVITGDTPQQISPTGAHHGPLLFPFDVNTSQQYTASGCQPTTTTTSTTTTTTTPSTTTTTAAVAGVTTIKVDGNGEAPASVESATTTPGAEPSSLALTGAPSANLALVGGLLLLSGIGLSVWARRTRPSAA